MGADVTRLPPHRARQAGIAMVLQTPRPFADDDGPRERRARGAVRLDRGPAATRPTASSGPTRRSASSAWPTARDDDVGTLNLHEQRFLELARALAGRPRLLLLDEVMAGLNDTELQARSTSCARPATELGVTVIWVEHVMKAVMSLAERVVVLNFGRCSPTARRTT